MNKALKKILKPILLPPYHLIKNWLYKDRTWLRILLSTLSPVLATRILYKKAFNKKFDLNNPQTLNEKLLWLKLNTYYKHPLITECCDKYLVRNYVERMGCKEILNDLIGVWDNPDQIDFESLPDKFVLKCNHGCGYNIICKNKKTLDIQKTKKQLKKWLHEDFWKLYAETQYKFIRKKIICEKFIETKNDLLPVDYKFFCENGKFKTLQVITDRETDINLYYFDELLKYRPDYYLQNNSNVDTVAVPLLPNNITEMIKIAECLSKPFPFVKVDLYNVEGKILFSELTFIPYGGIHYTNHANMPSSIKLTDIKEK
ncbi:MULTISPECIES: ATP-grasp fold amidoligase family protein [unclassified Treponema]|uniref:ATP-grasp fold amidoligase family protein n=1 Tax=unclassified Treponema TaxID=2638727 RepID=UPI0020A5CE03|nr:MULTISPECIES: ATP-grasp fold amidoligase family protein [unclassified Treponema]UTC68206.1 glycosyl transferase [Treponema sp. OMZ 789]UTC70926.1 glycosyl transferase [Treponema sp. OMZ 790]UTC73666.1 glycosyl transferase [Treponema sp. OMZ 791]